MQNQFYVFIAFILNGFLIGIIFDVFRVLRLSFKTPDIVTYLEDILFGVISGLLILFSIMKFNNGALRMYLFIGIILGISFYILIFSNIFIKFNVYIITLIKNIIKILIITPIKYIYKIIRKIVFKPIVFICFNVKKVFKKAKFHKKRIMLNKIQQKKYKV